MHPVPPRNFRVASLEGHALGDGAQAALIERGEARRAAKRRHLALQQLHLPGRVRRHEVGAPHAEHCGRVARYERGRHLGVLEQAALGEALAGL